jgi:glycosyltransferase involved in cell wall biosynthesis
MQNKYANRLKKPSIAICQPYIILGGRLQVILGIVRALNNLGIEPDILTAGTSFSPEKIAASYGQDLRFKFRFIQQHLPWKLLFLDYQVALFNRGLEKIASQYDLLIDSGNSQLFLPTSIPVISYIHFPSEYLLQMKNLSLHIPDNQMSYPLFRKLARSFIRPVYRRYSQFVPGRTVICNSKYTESAFCEMFPDATGSTRIIYPPVALNQYRSKPGLRENSVVSLGRFAPDKGQLKQIRLAESLPGLEFHFMGFVNSLKYFQACQVYVSKNKLTNVHLHPDIPFFEMITLMKTARYFLHTMHNEHFGITAVQAVATGCLPVVHDSGGQKETVPFDELRYISLDQVTGIIESLERKPVEDLNRMVYELQQNAEHNFEESVFTRRFMELLNEIL